jgi:hypothetical protein
VSVNRGLALVALKEQDHVVDHGSDDDQDVNDIPIVWAFGCVKNENEYCDLFQNQEHDREGYSKSSRQPMIEVFVSHRLLCPKINTLVPLETDKTPPRAGHFL